MLPLFLSLCLSYTSFPERIRTTVITGKSNEVVEIYTPNSQFIAAITYLNKEHTKISIASPSQSPAIELSNAPTVHALYFPSGNSKFVISFLHDSEVVVNFASIPSTACRSGIQVVVNNSHFLKIAADEPHLDRCYFFAYPSDKHRFKVTKNSLKSGAKLCAFHDFVNDDAYSCYIEGSSISTAFEPGGGSSAPWLFRFTTNALAVIDDSDIFVELNAPIKKDEYASFVKPFAGEPERFDEPPIDRFYKKWWIPAVGAVAPLFLLISWTFTFVRLLMKRTTMAAENP